MRCCSVRRKTLQGITLLWTLLQSGHEELGGTPLAKRIIICCPTSLVSNWDSECTKWLKACPCLCPRSLRPSHSGCWCHPPCLWKAGEGPA